MFYHKVLLISGLLISSLSIPAVQAEECLTYQDIQTQFTRHYGEQLLFRGFSDSKQEKGSNTIYELWGNPSTGSWSLLAQKLLVYQFNGSAINKNCTIMITSGSAFSQSSAFPTKDDNSRIRKPEHSAVLPETAQYSGNCIPHSHFVYELGQRFHENSVLIAVGQGGSVIEIFVSPDSWTIINANAGTVINPVTGIPVLDANTGQEIYQLCAMPVFSGKSWGLFKPGVDSI